MSGVVTDLRQAARRLAAQPVSSVLAGAMLALAIGITVAMFTVVDALMLRPAPFPGAEELVHVYAGNSGGAGRTTLPMEVYIALRQSPAFEAVHGVAMGGAIAEDGREPVQRNGAFVSPGLLPMFGAVPILGRTFTGDEGLPGARDRVILSERLWRAQFGADPAIVGRRITLSGVPHQVVGVLPDSFRFPSMSTEMWRPMDFAALQPGREQALDRPQVHARLSAAMPREDARRLATAAIREATGGNQEAWFRPIAAGLLDDYSRSALTMLAGGVAFVFLVLCANVTNLVLARASHRYREYGVCAALGASRLRLLRQALIESALLGTIAGAAGVVVAWSLVSLARAYLPDAFLLRSLNPLDLDARALGATLAAGLTATILAGVPGAWLGTSARAAGVGAGNTRTETRTKGERLVARGLLVGEIAFAAALLICATLLLRSFHHLVASDRGLDANGVITAFVSLPSHRFDDRASRLTFAAEMERVLRQLPGVAQVAMSYGLPPRGSTRYIGPVAPAGGGVESGDLFLSGYYVTGDFFRLYGMRVREGRTFSDADSPGSVVIAESVRERVWPGQPAVGRSFRLIGHDQPYVVIGVVNDLRSPSIGGDDEWREWYQPLVVTDGRAAEAEMFSTGQVMVGLRCADACPPATAIRDRIHDVSPWAVVSELGPLEGEYRELLARPRAAAAVATVFAITAGVAAGGGLFGVLSYAVSRRRRELGIRAALGARPRDLHAVVLREGATIGLLGLGLGALLAWQASGLLSSMLAAVTVADPLSWGLVLASIGTLVFAACLWPARQAASVDVIGLLKDG